MTSGVFFTCRTKPFERGLRVDEVTEAIREAWRVAPQNHRRGVVPDHVASEVFLPEERKFFFEHVAAVADWREAPISPQMVFVTTGAWGWTDRLIGHERPFFERFIEVVQRKDPYAAVGVARLLLGGSTNPRPLTFLDEHDIDALFARTDLPDNVVLEMRVHPDSR